jgi:hypothetical protein
LASTIGVTAIFLGSHGAAAPEVAVEGPGVLEVVAFGADVLEVVDVLVEIGFFDPFIAFAIFTQKKTTITTNTRSTNARRRRYTRGECRRRRSGCGELITPR